MIRSRVLAVHRIVVLVNQEPVSVAVTSLILALASVVELLDLHRIALFELSDLLTDFVDKFQECLVVLCIGRGEGG